MPFESARQFSRKPVPPAVLSPTTQVVPTQVKTPGPPGPTRLIKEAGDLQVYSAVQYTDCRTAICRGLQEYLQQLEFQQSGGRLFKFKKVLHTWAQPEDPAEYPSACVYAPGPGTYDSSSYTSSIQQLETLGPNQYLRKPCELMLDLIIEIYCTSPDERVAISEMMENALNPGDFMYGFLLEMPHYFNERAIFEPTSHEYSDESADSKRRLRRLLIGLTATMPVLQLRGFIAPLQVQTEVLVGSEDD